jgi:hypothetical protein
MPYFKNNQINLLFIHIPKTGGSSIEMYFSNKFNIPLNKDCLFVKNRDPSFKGIESTLQHMTYSTIVKYNNYFNINFNNITIITIVRNPYNRIMSDLFYLKRINKNSTKERVYSEIKKFIEEPATKKDNHNLPQYLYVTDENKNLINNLKILRTETLMVDMKKLGFTDFNIITNKNPEKINYEDYLNDMSIDLINKYYEYDFILFNYDKKN